MSVPWIQARDDSQRVCKTDDVSLLKAAFNIASSPQSGISIQYLLADCVEAALRQSSLRVLTFLFETYQESITLVQPQDLATAADSVKKSLPSVQLLDLLHGHGYDINSIGLPQNNSPPLLWHVCSSPKLVQWCLDHGAALVIPEQITSRNPLIAEIYHTPRLPLLLEMVAVHGSVPTFRKLRKLGAPLHPGISWRPQHAPRILHNAILAAVVFAPNGNKAPPKEYSSRLDMIHYLIDDLKLNVNGLGGYVDALTQPERPANTVYAEKEDSQRNVGKLVSYLLDRGADLDDLVKQPHSKSMTIRKGVWPGINDSHFEPDPRSIPLGCAEWRNEASFRRAVASWQKKNQKSQVKVASFPNLKREKLTGPMFLVRLPKEVLHLIGNYLRLEDLKSFRLTNRIISSIMFESLRYFICQKAYPLDTGSLNGLLQDLQRGGLSTYLEEAIFFTNEDQAGSVAMVQPIIENALDSSVQHILEELFDELGKIGRLKCLKILTATKLELAAIFQALQTSSLQLHSLSLYPDAGHQTGAVDYYTEFAQYVDPASILSSIRQFSWSLSVQPKVDGQPDNTPISIQQENLATIDRLLSLMPSLEKLDLFWFKRPPSSRLEADFLDSCLDSILGMNHLQEVHLRGIYITQAGICRFLRHTTVKRVHVHEVTIKNGTCQAVFDLLTSGKFTYFHIDDIYESRNGHYDMVRFDVPGKIKYATLRGGVGPSEIRREGFEATRKLSYRFARGRAAGSGVYQRYIWSQVRKYGKDI